MFRVNILWKFSMFLNKVIKLRSIAADKTREENKVRDFQSLSVQQPTAHRIVVESPMQGLAKK